MKIGLVGAPGAGKSDVARHLARQVEAQGGRRLPVAVVDNYVHEVEDSLDIACGFIGPYLADMAIALTRYGRERQAARDGAETIITCGTLAETATYTAMGLTVRSDELSWTIANVSMPYYALMAMNVMDYDYLFHLPLHGSESNDLVNMLDLEVIGSLRALKMRYEMLSEREPEDQATEALFLIEEHEQDSAQNQTHRPPEEA